MALRPILEAPDPRLRVTATPVKPIDDGLRTRIADLFEQMDDALGIELAVA
jgi:peptide deformylase